MFFFLIKNRAKPILLNLTVILLMAAGLTASCTNMPAKQSENNIPRQMNGPRDPPVALHATKQNKGERCAPRVYTQLEGEDDYNPYCYEMQLKLVKASEEGNLDEMKEALQEGAHPDGSVYHRFPPLFVASISGKVNAVRLLLDNGSDVNQVVDFQNTPLGVAVDGGHINVVRVLLERGANVCYQTTAGTDEEIARKKGYNEIEELLKAAKSTNCK
jgi:Ankyrin repeats (3 copies)